MIDTAPASLTATPAAIRRTLEVLHEPGDCFEIRVLGVPGYRGRRHNAAGYFNDFKSAAHAAAVASDSGATGVYVTINPTAPALLARSANRIQDNLSPTTSDADIARRRWLYLDFDPTRPASISATDAEQRAARELAHECEQYLTGLGWPLPVIGSSGNGYALLYRVDLPNDEAAKTQIASVLNSLDQHLRATCGDAAHLDTSVHNAARIVRLFGTANRKGDSITERPHRLSELYDPPEPLEIVTREQLEQLAGQAVESPATSGQASTRSGSSNGRPRLDMARWLADRGHACTVHQTGDGRTRYQIKDCVFDPSHNGSSACFIQDADGKPGYKCQHNSCGGHGWQEAKHAVGLPDPTHYDPPLGQRPQVSDERLPAGTKVRAKDRDNFGEIVADRGVAVAVKFVSPEGQTFVGDFRRRDLVLANGTPLAMDSTYNPTLLTAAAFDAEAYNQRFLVNRMLAAHQHAIIGGKSKACKTSVALDLTISLGSGTPFLGTFETIQTRTAILSGESGAATIQETARRIAAAKGLRLGDVDAAFGFELPQIARGDHLASLTELVELHGIGCLIIDPAYLCLLAGTEGKQAANLFDMGPILLGLADVAKWTDTTIVLLHHCRKNTADPFAPPELEELSMAGFAEWARQWLLIGRREQYEHDGQHRLWLNTGGSAGHSGCWAVDIDEGTIDESFGGRRWNIVVSQAKDARQEATKRREQRRAEDLEKKQDGYRRRLLEAIKQFPDGETPKQLRTTAGLNADNFATAIRMLLQEGRAEACQVAKGAREFEGFRPTGK